MKVFKTAQSALLKDLYDVTPVGDEFGDEIGPTVVDYDQLYSDVPIIQEDEIGQYIADNFEDEEIFDEEAISNPDVPIEITDEELPEFKDTTEALNYAISKNEVIRINYVTKKGIDLTRIIEPHHIYMAETGNLLVVTYDRSVRRIRAYIINNILNYIFTGKNFKMRMRVLPVHKGKIAMKKDIFVLERSMVVF